MKLSSKKFSRLGGRRLWAVLFTVAVVAGSSAWLFVSKQAQSAIASDDKFRVVMPSAFTATQSTDVYLEIAQTGKGNTLDAKQSWTKFYIEPGRASSATIGVFKGGYGGQVDTLGVNRGQNGQRLSDSNAVKYDFFLAINRSFEGVPEELPCPLAVPEGDELYSPSLTVLSGQMSVDGWYKIDASRFLNNATCNGSRWGVTQKSGKYVLFMRASWATSTPTVGGEKQGRVNAFKAGAAYANSSGTFDNPLTGYWSDFTSAYLTKNPEKTPDRAAYSVQDRLSPENTNGDYVFKFAPDCRLPLGKTEKRYLHWKDVDYPAYYQSPWPVQPAPEFDLIEVAPSGSKRVVLNVDASDGKFNGASQNVHGWDSYDFKGGHTYEWKWKNIARIDGVSFWLPYDDYPVLAGGCGQWDHDFTMRAGAQGALGTSEFRIAGGQTATINLVQTAKGKDAGPATDVDLTVTASNSPASGNKSIATTFEGVSATLGGSTSSTSTAFSRVIGWDNLGRLGPAPTYPPSRSDIYAYFKVRENAPDGARYCASAIMSPKSNTNPGGLVSNPREICFVIDNSLKPYLSTIGGDVHAGNDCVVTAANPRTPQTIIGQAVPGLTKGSSGSYVVSAGDAITNFGSGGTPGGTGLSFGKSGYYGSICRPDLATLQAELAKGGFTPVAADTATPFNLANLAPGQRYLVYFNGSGKVFGKSNAPVTVYSSETLEIQGTEFGANASTATSRTNLPVVGVIAKNINIKRDVVALRAQLYATESIDTCSDGTANNCKGVLLLQGFAMARDFSFKRSGTGSNGLQLAELFGFNAAFYLNPPPGFGTAAGAVKYLGERAPLY